MNPAAGLAWLWDKLLLQPLIWLLSHLVQGFAALGPTKAIGAFGLAVIIVTLVLRTLLFPLFQWQLHRTRRTQAEQRKVAPELAALRKKFKGNAKKLNEETMKLYKEHGISPFSGLMGCLPILVQWPILIALYQSIRQTASNLGHLHSDLGFLWISDVQQSGKDVCCAHANGFVDVIGGAFTTPAVLILPLLAGLATFVQSKMMMPPLRADMSAQELQASRLSRQMAYLMPVMIGVMALFFPQGIGLYWVTQSVVMVGQQWIILGWGGMKVPTWFPGAGRVTALSFPPGDGSTTKSLTAAKGRPAARGATTKVVAKAGARNGGDRPKGTPSGKRPAPRRRPSTMSSARRRRGR